MNEIDFNEIFTYDPETGLLHWKAPKTNRVKAGDVAGQPKASGYRYVGVGKKRYLAHRVVWEMHNGPIPPNTDIDHLNGDKSDNRLSNLRVATRSQNMTNVARPYGGRPGRFRGVSATKYGFAASIRNGGPSKHLGHYKTALEAARAYDEAALALHGPHATTNERLGLYG
jgi:hypothetical protein